ncbi:MAG: aspartyl-tRNA synthetase [Pseudomonadota bacterium]
MIEIELSSDELALLRRSIVGGGGFQDLMRSLRQKAAISRKMKLSDDDLEKIQRYAFDYGDGGFEGRLRGIFERHLGPRLNGYPD